MNRVGRRSGADAPPPDRPALTMRRCSAAARWLPRMLGGAVLASGLIVVLSLEAGSSLVGRTKALLAFAAAMAALWIVRAGNELRLQVGVGRDTVRLRSGRRFLDVPLAEIESLDYDPTLSTVRRWPPAMVLIDRHDRRFRIPANLRDGGVVLEEILRRAAAEDRLRTWADARRLAKRIASSRWVVVGGYAIAAALVGAAVWFARVRP